MSDTAERCKVFLTRNIFSPVAGFTSGDWLKILLAQRARVSPRYVPRALFITMNSFVNSVMKQKEDREFSTRLEGLSVPAPIFVLGHWRSGTTHLHNLLAQDPQFAYPTFYQTTQPHTFLSTEKHALESKLLKSLSPKTRVIDNMNASLDAPMEDEVALCILTGLSPIMGWLFPRQVRRFDRYLTFREVPDAEIERWKAGFIYFLRKLMLRYDRRIVLKSPPHTCRIRVLLELFPDARFVHIHRHPYEVFSSYKRSAPIMAQMLQLQRPPGTDFDQRVIEQYRVMYDAFLEERALIAEGRFAEVGFADLEREPIGELNSIYERLNLNGFNSAQPLFTRYLESIAGFRKSTLPEFEPSIKKRIGKEWKRFFDEWSYSM